MSTQTVSKEKTLKCLNCEHEFDGLAELKEHYIQGVDQMADLLVVL